MSLGPSLHRIEWYVLLLASVCAIASCSCGSQATRRDATPSESRAAQAVHAPSLRGATAWLNTEAPIDLEQLRGQVVVLDFWTYCCINCMHVLPVLAELEAIYEKQPVAVIGVHSAKFDAERDPRNILDAMHRYGVRHPVAVDSRLDLWRKYGIHAWPTLVLIRPNGTIADVLPGESRLAELKSRIDQLIADGLRDRSLARTRALRLRPRDSVNTPLAFPGKVANLPNGDIVVSDSGHHRILILRRDGTFRLAIGNGLQGWVDGSFAQASFDDPQGLAVAANGKRIFLADAKAHVVRFIDLEKRMVSTIAGTGELGRGALVETPAPARDTALRSPWDVALSMDETELYVALAGSHQIAAIRLLEAQIRSIAGSGRESIVDGAGGESAFAQPSGLSRLGTNLFVADSESSGVRRVSLSTGATTTVVGKGLFEFGDRDGPVRQALLQHPLHVVAASDGVFVADTYNGAIKRIHANRVETFFRGRGEFALRQPGGMVRENDGSLLIADTGHQRLLRLRGAKAEPEVVTVKSVPSPLEGRVERARPQTEPITATVQTPRVSPNEPAAVAWGKRDLTLRLEAPAGHEFSEGSPVDVEWIDIDRKTVIGQASSLAKSGRTLEVRLSLEVTPTGPRAIRATPSVVLCDAVDHRYCKPLSQPLELLLPPRAKVGAQQVRYTFQLALVPPPPR